MPSKQKIHVLSNGQRGVPLPSLAELPKVTHIQGNGATGHPGRIYRDRLFSKYATKLKINPDLSRALVSFQANKGVPFYRWLKYKEGFSSNFVDYCLSWVGSQSKKQLQILDPFAGVGTTLTTAAARGSRATGIELLPVGVAAIRARLFADRVSPRSFKYHLNRLALFPLDLSQANNHQFEHLRITEKAFSKETESAIDAYDTFLGGIRSRDVKHLFWFACLSVLEEVSYTRKDGQFLRWDFRSGRSLKSSFNKGRIYKFREAVTSKLYHMLEDIETRNGGSFAQSVNVIEGSSLVELARLSDSAFDLVVTSPPYCNRYDYTRTYALELAFLGYDEDAVKNLRQTLLSATVENRSKRIALEEEYRLRGEGSRYQNIFGAFVNQRALHEVLGLLYKARDNKELNNNNIPSMVENYFFEMNVIIHELARVLAPGGHIVMVNDNVQYHGEEVPVDLILSDFAVSAGLAIKHIWVLPRGKGNSSQQMSAFGRNEIRKCVYVWSKPGSRKPPYK